MTDHICEIFKKVKKQNPLVHHLTNWVTIYDCANIVKVFGASPVMAHAPQEVVEMVRIASALVCNIGTLTDDFVASMKIAGKSANQKGIPVILDVCGAGATSFRDFKCFELMEEVAISILKGNASEIAKIAGEEVKTKGVDAVKVDGDLLSLAKKLAVRQRAVVVITGEQDIVSDGLQSFIIKNGHAIMSHVVGTGCMAASVIGAFAAVEKDFAKAACAGLCCFEIAAELAAAQVSGPGSFKERLFDEAYYLEEKKIHALARIDS